MVSRRDFLKISGTAAITLAGVEKAQASEEHLDPDRFGVLADFTLCIGCRSCEWACSSEHDLPHGKIEEYDDPTPMENMRRPHAEQLTVINAYDPPAGQEKDLTVKVNCLHCEKPACVSACIVGALEKDPRGPVTYNAWECIGCRYCMVACPFSIPAYEYDNALTPKVVKCDLCAHMTLDDGVPACVDICPTEALLFGKRSELLQVAKDRIRYSPERYVDKVYGEHDAGGTSWLYLCDRDFTKVDLPEVPDSSPAYLTENIQHGIFRGFSGPAMILGLLSVLIKSSGKVPPEKDLPSRNGGES